MLSEIEIIHFEDNEEWKLKTNIKKSILEICIMTQEEM